MIVSIVCFTDRGRKTAETLFDSKDKNEVNLICKMQGNGPDNLKEWVKQQFEDKNPLIFVGALGIAVRMIAPFIKTKLNDIPVVVVDEAGRFVIPVLSGHMGGANELANQIAKKTGAIPVITTATDINETFSVDIFAKKNHLTIQNKEGIARISSRVLKNEIVDIVISPDCTQLSHGILRMKPKEYILGIGCRKGKSFEELSEFIGRYLTKLGIVSSDILMAASIDLKKNEEGIIRWCNGNRIPFQTYSAEELLQTEGTFSTSEFVKEKTGVDNVCERACLRACNGKGKLILKKQAENGMTIAVAKKPWIFDNKNQEGIIIDEK